MNSAKRVINPFVLTHNKHNKTWLYSQGAVGSIQKNAPEDQIPKKRPRSSWSGSPSGERSHRRYWNPEPQPSRSVKQSCFTAAIEISTCQHMVCEKSESPKMMSQSGSFCLANSLPCEAERSCSSLHRMERDTRGEICFTRQDVSLLLLAFEIQ